MQCIEKATLYETVLKRMTRRQRQAWNLHVRVGLSPAAIARRLAISPSAVSRLLARARQRAGGPYRANRHRQPQIRSVRPLSLADVYNV